MLASMNATEPRVRSSQRYLEGVLWMESRSSHDARRTTFKETPGSRGKVSVPMTEISFTGSVQRIHGRPARKGLIVETHKGSGSAIDEPIPHSGPQPAFFHGIGPCSGPRTFSTGGLCTYFNGIAIAHGTLPRGS